MFSPRPPHSFAREADDPELRVLHRAALTCLVLAAATGMLWRVQSAFGIASLDFRHVRHAHSHLMFFGWVTPAAMAQITLAVRRRNPSSAVPRKTIWLALVLGLLSHPLFLAFGYGKAQLGGRALPLSVIVAGASTWVWYAFVAWYLRERRRRRLRLPLVDIALSLLMLSTLGAWGLSALIPLHVKDPLWSELLKSQFLSTFSEGWLVAAGLHALHLKPAVNPATTGRIANVLFAASAPFAFLSTLAPQQLPSLVAVGSSVASVALGVALLLQAHVAHRAGAYRIPLVFLAFAGLARIVVGVTPGVSWHALHGLRILVLHALLLGFATLSLSAVRSRLRALEASAATLLVLSVAPLTEIWPRAWAGTWALYMAVMAAAAMTAVFAFSALDVGRPTPPQRSPRPQP
ncbi:MAG: hypothetical protein R3B13_02855 [Polyangiaceae bacterium]